MEESRKKNENTVMLFGGLSSGMSNKKETGVWQRVTCALGRAHWQKWRKLQKAPQSFIYPIYDCISLSLVLYSFAFCITISWWTLNLTGVLILPQIGILIEPMYWSTMCYFSHNLECQTWVISILIRLWMKPLRSLLVTLQRNPANLL